MKYRAFTPYFPIWEIFRGFYSHFSSLPLYLHHFTLSLYAHLSLYPLPVACAGFILAGAENEFRGGRKKFRGAKIFSAPPAEYDSAPGAEQTREEAENLIIPRKRGRNI